jgi:hypothetical protein
MNAMIIGNFYHLSCLSDKKIKKNIIISQKIKVVLKQGLYVSNSLIFWFSQYDSFFLTKKVDD